MSAPIAAVSQQPAPQQHAPDLHAASQPITGQHAGEQGRGGWPPVLVVNGVTASGKSSLAIEVALELDRRGWPTEIINTDSMLVYRGMDIGTAKPSPAVRRGVPHHLVDVMEVTQTASVAWFQQQARAAISACRARGVLPLLVGGSALYVHAIIDEFEFPATDPVVRGALEARLELEGPAALHAELARRDPASAAAILPGNGRRVVRALEVLELTGGVRPQLPAWSYALEGVHQVGLDLPRDVMDARINARVEQMWADGLVAEVRDLEGRGLRDGVTASRALGYRQVLQMLDGELSEQQAQEQTASGTRRFARKQLGWLRRDPRIQWVAADAPDALHQVIGVLDLPGSGSTPSDGMATGDIGSGARPR